MALHTQALGDGDKVTLVRLSNGESVIFGRVIGHSSADRILVHISGAPVDHLIDYSEEGVRWIRGHAPNGTHAVEALLAAYKLSKMISEPA
jgi:hypothetical protein